MLADVRRIHETSVRNNGAAGITGALLFSDLWFVQMLEGDRSQVSAAFTRIAEHDRHSRVCIVDARTEAQRAFTGWNMRLITRDRLTEGVLLRRSPGKVFRPDAMTADDLRGLLLELYDACGLHAA